nr:MAG TPA: hypothetical protein [Caudoviricetes sp.]
MLNFSYIQIKLSDCINLTANLGLLYGISDYLSPSHSILSD